MVKVRPNDDLVHESPTDDQLLAPLPREQLTDEVEGLPAGTEARLLALLQRASSDARRVAFAVLRSDVENQAWRRQLGPALTQVAAADLLGITPQGVAKRASAGEVLRLENADGRPAYPLFQFEGRRVVSGLPEVIRVLGEVDDPLTTAAWLTAPKRLLQQRSPVDALRDGETDLVLDAAADYLARSS